VKIWVNQAGKVVNARVKVTGTTTSSTKLQNLAINAALKAKFNANPDAAEVQTGTITYQFIL
jgi:TonB family protein